MEHGRFTGDEDEYSINNVIDRTPEGELQDQLGPKTYMENALTLFYTFSALQKNGQFPEERLQFYTDLVEKAKMELPQSTYEEINARVLESLGRDVKKAPEER